MELKIAFWVCVLVAITVWIVESALENKVHKNTNRSSSLVLTTLFSAATGVPPEASKLIADNKKLQKWIMALIIARYLLLAAALILRIWFM